MTTDHFTSEEMTFKCNANKVYKTLTNASCINNYCEMDINDLRYANRQ